MTKPKTVSYSVAVADPDYPSRVLKPNADGSINIYDAGANLAYTLASNAAIASGTQTTPVTGVVGGSYIWTVTGTFNGSTQTLQTLGPDGVTWIGLSPAASLTANGSVGVVLGANASVRISGTVANASAMYSSLS